MRLRGDFFCLLLAGCASVPVARSAREDEAAWRDGCRNHQSDACRELCDGGDALACVQVERYADACRLDYRDACKKMFHPSFVMPATPAVSALIGESCQRSNECRESGVCVAGTCRTTSARSPTMVVVGGLLLGLGGAQLIGAAACATNCSDGALFSDRTMIPLELMLGGTITDVVGVVLLAVGSAREPDVRTTQP